MTYLSDAIDYADHVGAKAIARPFAAEVAPMRAIEACSSLIYLLSLDEPEYKKGPAIVEECADVIITALQLARIHSADTRDLERAISAKTDRLAARLAEEDET